ncbi:Conjugative transposon protein [Staphylococcus aureus]|nr:Conjugative transposon protein [Staphylococcus aureus]
MIIKIERKEKKEKPKKSKKPSKQRKVPMIKVGTHKKLTFVLWVLLIGSVGF